MRSKHINEVNESIFIEECIVTVNSEQINGDIYWAKIKLFLICNCLASVFLTSKYQIKTKLKWKIYFFDNNKRFSK